MNETLRQVKHLIKELKQDKRYNVKEMKAASRCHSYTEAAHLDSANVTLDYIIVRLQDIVDAK